MPNPGLARLLLWRGSAGGAAGSTVYEAGVYEAGVFA
jgi:hypothetical protein